MITTWLNRKSLRSVTSPSCESSSGERFLHHSCQSISCNSLGTWQLKRWQYGSLMPSLSKWEALPCQPPYYQKEWPMRCSYHTPSAILQRRQKRIDRLGKCSWGPGCRQLQRICNQRQRHHPRKRSHPNEWQKRVQNRETENIPCNAVCFQLGDSLWYFAIACFLALCIDLWAAQDQACIGIHMGQERQGQLGLKKRVLIDDAKVRQGVLSKVQAQVQHVVWHKMHSQKHTKQQTTNGAHLSQLSNGWHCSKCNLASPFPNQLDCENMGWQDGAACCRRRLTS